MSSSHAIRVSADIDASQAAVWERVSDHERTPSWVDAVKRVSLAQSGTPPNGLGAIRIVSFKPALWSTIHERITRFEPPESFDYVLFKGMPALRSHLGTVSVDDLGRDRSRLNWNVDFVFRTVHPFTLFLPSFLRQFEEVLKAGVENLRRQLESGIEHAHH
jgi:hypothetical protein